MTFRVLIEKVGELALRKLTRHQEGAETKGDQQGYFFFFFNSNKGIQQGFPVSPKM